MQQAKSSIKLKSNNAMPQAFNPSAHEFSHILSSGFSLN